MGNDKWIQKRGKVWKGWKKKSVDRGKGEDGILGKWSQSL